jgi:hypothetical protein
VKLRSPAIVAAAVAAITYASGGLNLISKALDAFNSAATQIIDLRKVVPQIGDYVHIAPPAKAATKHRARKHT